MGDVIGSSEYQPAALMNNMRELVDSTNKTFRNELLSPLTITLGDEFQGLHSTLKGSLEVLFFLEEYRLMKQWDFAFRFVVHFGAIETQIIYETAHGMLGRGLTRAREQLQQKNKKYRILISDEDQFKTDALNRLFRVMDGIKSKWKPRYYPLLHDMIQNPDNGKVAGIHGKNDSQIWKMRRNNLIEEYRELKSTIFDITEL